MPSRKFNKANPQPPSAESIEVASMASGRLGDTMANHRNHIAGNMSPSSLGGDNRQDLGRNHISGNASPNEVAVRQYGWTGEDRRKTVTHNPEPDEVKRWFRGGSDATGMKSGPGH